MSYSVIDSILNAWARSHNLHIQKKYQDCDVRSIEIVSPDCRRFQLWVEEPSQSGKISIHIWDFKKQKRSYVATQLSLQESLELAYHDLKSWW